MLFRKRKVLSEEEKRQRRKVDAGYHKVWRAVKSGLLPKLDGSVLCVDCQKPANIYEHRDYNKPLDVEPVCYSCNRRRGAAIRPILEQPREISTNMPFRLHEKCTCGRETLHCPNCGVANVYHVARMTLGNVLGYHCRKCGADFRQDSQCTAPPLDLLSNPSSQATKSLLADKSESAKASRKLAIDGLRQLGYTKQADEREKAFKEQGLL